jgi:hypothetical protein
MSWSFSVPATPSADFADAAATAKSNYETQLSGNDYILDQLASGQADEAIKAASEVVASGVLGEGNVSALLSGHAVAEGQPAGSQSVSIAVSCVPVEPAAPAEPPAPAPTT